MLPQSAVAEAPPLMAKALVATLRAMVQLLFEHAMEMRE